MKPWYLGGQTIVKSADADGGNCVFQCDRKRDKKLREDWDELRSSRRSSPGVEGIGITSTGRR